MVEGPVTWLGFIAFVIIMLAFDLYVVHRKPHEVKIKEALLWSAMWIALAFIFNYGVYIYLGKEKALEFMAAYLVEKSLSIDNLFVFILIFDFFNVKPQFQHKILFWGIIGALILRAIFIVAGIALINNFHWITYVFGIFLIITGIRLPFQKDKKIEPDKNIFVRLFKRFMSVTPDMDSGRLFKRINHKNFATPLFITLILIEFTDLIFAVDSIPAVLAISNDVFIVYTSNVFAILGLRSLYFALAGIMKYFTYLKYGLSAVLVFVGIKMCISGYYKFPVYISLSVIGGLLLLSILFSILYSNKSNGNPKS